MLLQFVFFKFYISIKIIFTTYLYNFRYNNLQNFPLIVKKIFVGSNIKYNEEEFSNQKYLPEN